MSRFPRAILFDLDDTIISAYGRPDLAWSVVIAEFAQALAPLAVDEVRAVVQASADQFWSNADRHRLWRQKLRDARREIVVGAFASLAQRGIREPDRSVQHALADRFSDYRDEQMHIYPDAHATIDELRERGMKLALITNGDAVG